MSATNDRIMRLKEEIAKENLSFQEMERRLSAAIDAEYEKKCSDIQFINACEDLLWELKTEGKLKFESKNEQYRTAMQKHMKPIKQSNNPAFAARFVTVFAALVLVFVLAEGVFHWEWLTGTMTKDNQQYVVKGHQIDAGMISTSIASHQKNAFLVTEDYQEAINFLGFSPSIPDLQVFNLNVQDYGISYSDEDIVFHVSYYDMETSEKESGYTICFVTECNEFIQPFEQSTSDHLVKINGIDVHIGRNNDSKTYTWIDENTVHRLFINTTVNTDNVILDYIKEVHND